MKLNEFQLEKGKNLPVIFLLVLPLLSCQHSEHRAQTLKTKIDKSVSVGGNQKIGIKEGLLVYQKKVLINEELRQLQNRVYELEDKVYGNQKYGSQGLYGNLKQCKRKISLKQYGGDGKLKWIEPPERVTKKEEKWKIGLSEKEQIVGVSEDFLKNRLKRFREYKNVLQKREEEYREKIEICEAEFQSRLYEIEKNKQINTSHHQSKD